ncbi:aspartate-semialdehyde dehydrogenase [Gammaproteobacteria bacterium]|nr:aspartate-semialdehyde dehydrogenase [Gammaproteobacteria bacterium]
MKTGVVGWRGMVGSVLMQRMRSEGDFSHITPTFFSTSQAGQTGPAEAGDTPLADAHDLHALADQDVIISCQGGDYTQAVHGALRARGWSGYWIDAASTLRMADDSVIILDPVNRDVIDRALDHGQRDFVGGNCTTSITLMAIAGLMREGWVEWVSSMTYQAASGGGARHMKELLAQMGHLHGAVAADVADPASDVIAIEKRVTDEMNGSGLPRDMFGKALAGSLLPWIDSELDNGQSREEWKGGAETNKILGLEPNTIPVDGLCVRVGSLRCHAKGLTIKLKRDIPLDEIEAALKAQHQWLRYVPNHKEQTLDALTPATVSGTLDIAVGRVRKMAMGGDYLSAFAIGDQLLWGAAEPLRRMLRIILERA